MGTKIRNEISKRKEYWIPKHRQLELVHFCLQYPDWKEKLRNLDGHSKKSSSVVSIPEKNGLVGKPVERIVDERLYFKDRIEMVESAAKEAGAEFYDYLLKGVTEKIGYENLRAPCCKEIYYIMYRHFFWLLDKSRQ